MILATVRYAENPSQYPEPEPVKLYRQWQTFKVLPEGGGLRDQRVGELDLMQYCWRICQAIRGFAGAKSAKDKTAWTEQNPQLWALWQQVQEMKLTNGNDSR